MPCYTHVKVILSQLPAPNNLFFIPIVLYLLGIVTVVVGSFTVPAKAPHAVEFNVGTLICVNGDFSKALVPILLKNGASNIVSLHA